MTDLNKLKPSTLLYLGITSWMVCDLDERYVINPELFHNPRELRSDVDNTQKVTHVCMAGSVMAQEFNLEPNVKATPDDYPQNSDRLMLLDTYTRFGLKAFCATLKIDYRRFDYTSFPEAEHNMRTLHPKIIKIGRSKLRREYIVHTFKTINLLRSNGY